nr:hypothetical protein [Tanacetum cinerariifolium]
MMDVPNEEHQLNFNSINDAKQVLKDVEKRFGGNNIKTLLLQAQRCLIKPLKDFKNLNVLVETTTYKVLVSCDGLRGYDWSNQAEEDPNYVLMAFTSANEFVDEPVDKNNKAKPSKEEPKAVRKNDEVPIIEEWVSENKEEDVS